MVTQDAWFRDGLAIILLACLDNVTCRKSLTYQEETCVGQISLHRRSKVVAHGAKLWQYIAALLFPDSFSVPDSIFGSFVLRALLAQSLEHLSASVLLSFVGLAVLP